MMRYDKIVSWLQERNDAERLFLLILASGALFFIGYAILISPMLKQKEKITQKIQLLETPLQLIQGQLNAFSHHRSPGLIQIPVPMQTTQQQLIKVISRPQSNIQLFSLTSQSDKQSLQVKFLGNYFSTISYLHYLENLPWCLAWDSLEYRVTKYPEAEVTLNLQSEKSKK